MAFVEGSFGYPLRAPNGQRILVPCSADWRNRSEHGTILPARFSTGKRLAIGVALAPRELDNYVIPGRLQSATDKRVLLWPQLKPCQGYIVNPPADTTCCYGYIRLSTEISGVDGMTTEYLAQYAWEQQVIAWWEGLGGTFTAGEGELGYKCQVLRVDDEWRMACNYKDEGAGPVQCNCDELGCLYAFGQACAIWDESEGKWLGQFEVDLVRDDCVCDCADLADCDPPLPSKLVVTFAEPVTESYDGSEFTYSGEYELTYVGGCVWMSEELGDAGNGRVAWMRLQWYGSPDYWEFGHFMSKALGDLSCCPISSLSRYSGPTTTCAPSGAYEPNPLPFSNDTTDPDADIVISEP